MPDAELSRKEREKLYHKSEIIRAALILFSKKSFHDVSMQEIAEKSEFSVGTLYNFFENKDSLFSELIRSCAQKIHDTLIPIFEETEDDKTKISKYIKAHKQIANENARIIRMYLLQYPNSFLTIKPEIDPVADALRDKIQSKLSDVLKSGISKGLFKDVNPNISALLLLAQLESVTLQHVMYQDKTSIEDAISIIEELFMDGILKKDENVNETKI